MKVRGLVFALAVVAIGAGCGDDVGPTPASVPRPIANRPLATITEFGGGAGTDAKVAFDGSTLLLPLGGGGLALYDLSRASQPTYIGTVGVDALGGQAGSVASRQGRAFVATPGVGGLVELDLRTPGNPRVLSRFGADVPWIGQVVLRGYHLFVQSTAANGAPGGIYVFDVAGGTPVLVGRYLVDLTDPGFYATEERTVYLARTPPTPARIDVVDMLDPGNPRLATSWFGPGNVFDIDVYGHRVYCASYWGGVQVLSRSQTASLRTEATYDWPDASAHGTGIAAAPPYVFVARGQDARQADSLQVFRHDGNALTPVSEQEVPLPIVSLTVAGNLLAVVELESSQARAPRKCVALYAISRD